MHNLRLKCTNCDREWGIKPGRWVTTRKLPDGSVIVLCPKCTQVHRLSAEFVEKIRESRKKDLLNSRVRMF